MQRDIQTKVGKIRLFPQYTFFTIIFNFFFNFFLFFFYFFFKKGSKMISKKGSFWGRFGSLFPVPFSKFGGGPKLVGGPLFDILGRYPFRQLTCVFILKGVFLGKKKRDRFGVLYAILNEKVDFIFIFLSFLPIS